MLRTKLPHLYSLGVHDPETRTGPAFAFRIATAEAEAAGAAPPILWLLASAAK